MRLKSSQRWFVYQKFPLSVMEKNRQRKKRESKNEKVDD